MKATVAVVFRIFNIILLLYENDIVLAKQGVCKCINIFGKRADNPDACNVVQILFDGLCSDGEVVSFQFLLYANG